MNKSNSFKQVNVSWFSSKLMSYDFQASKTLCIHISENNLSYLAGDSIFNFLYNFFSQQQWCIMSNCSFIFRYELFSLCSIGYGNLKFWTSLHPTNRRSPPCVLLFAYSSSITSPFIFSISIFGELVISSSVLWDMYSRGFFFFFEVGMWNLISCGYSFCSLSCS